MTTNWNELKPSSGDPLNELPSILTSQARSLRDGLEAHFHWTDSSGASAGEPRFSSLTTQPGSARAFFGTNSQISANKNGTLMLTSNNERLYALSSGNSILIGSVAAIIADGGSTATIPNNVRWLVQSGSTTSVLANTASNQTFPSAYSVAPLVEVQVLNNGSFTRMGTAAVTAINTSGFSFRISQYGSSSSFGLLWRSEGTVSLV